jgi:hypothetical protein
LFADSLRNVFNDREANLSGAAAGFKLGFNSLEDNRLVVALTALFAYSCRHLLGEGDQFVAPEAWLLDAPLDHAAAAIRAVIIFIFGPSHRYLRRILSSIHFGREGM